MGTMETEDKLPGVIGGSAAGGSSVHSNGSIAESNGSKHHHDTALTNKSGIHMEGQNDVTAEDLALRVDICHQIFGDAVGALVRDFSCAWDHKVVMHGRMYVTEYRLCFYANFFGLEAKMSLRHEDIARCNKGNSAIFIPNVIVVQDKAGKDFVFRNFWERDECHSLLERLRREAEGGALPVGHVDEAPYHHGERSVEDDSSPERVNHTTVHRESDNGNASKVDSRFSPPSPPLPMSRNVSPPPTQRRRSNSLPPSTLPGSPKSKNSSPTRAPVTRHDRTSSMTHQYKYPSGYAAAAVAAGGDSGRLGLAILGGEHDIPAPYGRHPFYSNQSGRHHLERRSTQPPRSPRLAAVVTGEGRAGWGSDIGVSGRGGDRGDGEDKTRGDRHLDGRKEAGEEEMKTARGEGEVRGGRLHRRRPERRALLTKAPSLWRWGRGRVDAEAEEEQRKALEEAVAKGSGGGPDHTEVATAEFPVSAREFYERFFADDAPYSLPDFHMSRGDWEVDATEWQATEGDSDGSGNGDGDGCRNSDRPETEVEADTEPDGGSEAGEKADMDSEPMRKELTRALRFKTPLHITFMSSPGQVRTLKRQRARFFGKQGCVVDTITTVEDNIPLSDNFHVEDRWVIRAARKDGEECTVTVSWRCVWHKFTVIKGLIEGKCRSDVQSFNIAFLEGMREHLVEKHVQTSSRRPSSRGGRRKSREGPLPGSSRRRYPSFDKQHEAEDEGRERSTSAFADSEAGDSDMASYKTMLEPYLPVMRVLCTIFVVYISIFWVLHQIRYDGSLEAETRKGGNDGVGTQDLTNLYMEWGRTNVALLNVRDHSREFSSELLQLLGKGDLKLGGGGARASITREEKLSLVQLVAQVSAMADKTDKALETLGSTVSRLLDASTDACVLDRHECL